MKALARSYVWWPLIDTDIESVVKECNLYQQRHKLPAASPLHPWEWPQWSRVHIDYAGPIRDEVLLIIVDVHSKWIDVHVTNLSTASVTIQKLLTLLLHTDYQELLYQTMDHVSRLVNLNNLLNVTEYDILIPLPIIRLRMVLLNEPCRRCRVTFDIWLAEIWNQSSSIHS